MLCGLHTVAFLSVLHMWKETHGGKRGSQGSSFLLLNNDIWFVSLKAPAKEEMTHVESSTSVPEAVCAPARKRKAAEMGRCAVSATAAGTEEPPAKRAAVVRTVAEAVVDPQS